MDYVKRFADNLLENRLRHFGAVQITGPKFCGKTETATRQAGSRLNMQTDPSVATAMASDPRVLLLGEIPRLIDEWQEYPLIRNTVRHEVDGRKTYGQFILTGSATPNDETEARLHSGAGRIAQLRMRTMTWAELGWSDGSIKLTDILAGKPLKTAAAEVALQEIARRIAIGGWPGQINNSETIALTRNQAYVDNTLQSDIGRVSGVRRDPVRVRRIFESYARNLATPAKVSTITNDAISSDQSELDRSTVNAYLDDLQRLMIVDDLPAWNTHIRSSAKLRVTPKRHFADPSLAVATLNLSSETLIKDLKYMGFLFESLVVHDLRVYAEAAGASAYYYRDSDGDEADVIIETRSGTFAAFEVKLGMGAVEEAVASLNRFKAKLTDKKQAELISLNIIVGSGYAYTRPDGINVIPVSTLGL